MYCGHIANLKVGSKKSSKKQNIRTKNSIRPTQLRVSYAPNKTHGWGHQIWFEDLISYLETQFDVEPLRLDREDTTVCIETAAYQAGLYKDLNYIRDTEIVIENLENHEIVVVSFSESVHDIIDFLKNPYCKHFYFVHHYWKLLDCRELRTELSDRHEILKPFFGLDLYNIDNHRNYAKHRINYSPENSLTDEMFCKARGVRGEHAFRKVLGILEDDYGNKINDFSQVSYEEYLKQAKQSKIALSYSSDFDTYYIDLCHRDMEYAMIGLPFIRIEFQNKFIEPLIPDVHYISIPYEKAVRVFEDKGHGGVADLIANRYDEVINNHDFLTYVSHNISAWFDRNMQPAKSVKRFAEMSMSDWKYNQTDNKK